MPVNPTYPGVYVQEVPSGNRTIVGVSTSVTAFVGRARRGPANEPITLHTYADFTRIFGALWVKSPLGYAVQQYFLAGGRDAVIVRVPTATDAAATAELPLHDSFRLEARTIGTTGGTGIGVWIEHETTNLYQFTLHIGDDTTPTTTQSWDVTLDPDDASTTHTWIGNLAQVLDDADALVRVTSLSLARPRETSGWEGLAGGSSTVAASLAKTSGAARLAADVTTTAGNAYVAVVSYPAGSSSTAFTIVVTDHPTAPTTSNTFNLTLDPGGETISATAYTYVGSFAAAGLVSAGSFPLARPAEGTYNFEGGGTSAAVAELGLASHVTVSASSAGAWGNKLTVEVDHDTADDTDPDLFNLTVREYDSGGVVIATESFRNVSMLATHARYAVTVLEEESDLATIGTATYAFHTHQRLADSSDDETYLTGGVDGTTDLDSGDVIGNPTSQTGMYALEQVDLFNLLCLPPPAFDDELDAASWAEALAYCEDRRAVCIVDADPDWASGTDAYNNFPNLGLTSTNGAMYFPRVKIADPLRENRLTAFAPCGVVAGLIAKTDAQRGIWKAPAGLDARTPIVRGLEVTLTDAQHGQLNPLGLNCLRTFPGVGTVVWGGRTLAGNDKLASEWKYLPVRRLALYIEESLYRGMQWAVFEPNDEPLWAQIRLSAGSFMHQLFRQKAFKGAAAKDAYFVKCDAETTTSADIDRGIVNVHIGFAPLKPAEFVVISIQQIAGQANT